MRVSGRRIAAARGLQKIIPYETEVQPREMVTFNTRPVWSRRHSRTVDLVVEMVMRPRRGQGAGGSAEGMGSTSRSCSGDGMAPSSSLEETGVNTGPGCLWEMGKGGLRKEEVAIVGVWKKTERTKRTVRAEIVKAYMFGVVVWLGVVKERFDHGLNGFDGDGDELRQKLEVWELSTYTRKAEHSRRLQHLEWSSDSQWRLLKHKLRCGSNGATRRQHREDSSGGSMLELWVYLCCSRYEKCMQAFTGK